MTTMNIGEEGFWWFLGIVEDRDDPKKLGRLRVRIHNIHSSKKTIAPTNDLPWASPLTGIISASLGGVGVSPTGILVGTTVFGFFVDGRACQYPVILGTLPGIPGNDVEKHDVPPEAREQNKVKRKPIGPEPASPYKSKFPYNKVMRTESGHVIEVDDTPGAERIQIFHKSGTYNEIDPNGRQVTKVVGDDYTIVAGKQEIYVEGNVNVVIKGNATINVQGNASTKVGGTYTVESGGNMKFTAPRIDLN